MVPDKFPHYPTGNSQLDYWLEVAANREGLGTPENMRLADPELFVRLLGTATVAEASKPDEPGDEAG